MAPPSACCKTKGIVARGKDPPFERLFSIYQCQRDFVGSLEDAEKRRQLDSWNCRRLGHPRTTCKHQRGCVLQSVFSKKSLEKAAQIKVADLPAQAVQEFTILSQGQPYLPLPPSLPPKAVQCLLSRRLAMPLRQELKGHGLRFHLWHGQPAATRWVDNLMVAA